MASHSLVSGVVCVVCPLAGDEKLATFMSIQRYWYEVLPSSVTTLLYPPKPIPLLFPFFLFPLSLFVFSPSF